MAVDPATDPVADGEGELLDEFDATGFSQDAMTARVPSTALARARFVSQSARTVRTLATERTGAYLSQRIRRFGP